MRQLSECDILCAREVHLYDGHTLFVVTEGDRVFGWRRGAEGWYEKENFWEYFESELMMAYLQRLTPAEGAALWRAWKGEMP